MSENNLNSGPVVLIGAGFAGLTTALALSRSKKRPPIILVEPKSRFIFLPLLYELLSEEVRTWEIAPSYKSILADRGIVLIQDYVKSINTQKQIIIISSGEEISYGQVLICTGSKPNDFGVPGVSEHALTFHSLKDIELLKRVIRRFKQVDHIDQSFVIVGAGSAGIELACKLSDVLGEGSKVCLIESADRILPHGKSFNQEQAERALKQRDIQIYLQTKVLSITASSVELRSHTQQNTNPFHLAHGGLIWTGGTKAVCPQFSPSVSFKNGLISINSYLQVIGLKNVFALGDMALNSDTPTTYPRTAQVAMQQGEIAARNVLALRSGTELMPFQYQDRGEMLSLGIGEATITGLGVTIAGPMAFYIRRMAYLTKLPNLSLSIRSAGAWLLGKKQHFE